MFRTINRRIHSIFTIAIALIVGYGLCAAEQVLFNEQEVADVLLPERDEIAYAVDRVEQALAAPGRVERLEDEITLLDARIRALMVEAGYVSEENADGTLIISIENR